MDTYINAPNSTCSLGFSPRRTNSGKASERGVALIITLLLLSMITALSVGMVIALSSQTLIGGYYRNFRGSFYAADSGLNVVRQQAITQLEAGIPATFTYPPPANACGSTASASTTISSDYGSSTSLNTGTAAQSWNESFKITNITLGPTTLTPNAQAQTYSCTYQYSITSVGSALGSEQQTVTETGNLTLNVSGPQATETVSFAYFGAFIDDYQGGIGPLVPGTMTGPMFTNTAWEFMANTPPWTAPYIFTDPVGQQQGQVYYWVCCWGYSTAAASSDTVDGTLIDPTFEQGLQLNQPKVNLPTNSFNQMEAVIDGYGTEMTPAQTTAALTTLVNPSGALYVNTSTPGIYMNKGTTAAACGTKATPCMAGGGFYIEGGASVELVPSGATAQVYSIVQNGVTTTITIDPAANGGVGTTVIAQGTNPAVTLNGVPMDAITQEASTMVYVDGTVNIQGPGEGQGAIQDNAMINVTANGDIIATGDILYKTEPVTIPQDTLIPAASNMNQVLGLYTAVGNFITNSNQPDGNIEVDGSIATISQSDSANNCASGEGGQLSYTNINTFNNVGGMIQSCIYPAPVNAENTWFDRRFTSRQGFAPPWFPSTQIQTGGPLTSNVTASAPQRIQWLSTSSE